MADHAHDRSPLTAHRSSMVDGRWSMVDGRWSMVDGRWSMVDGRWSMVDGRWSDSHFLSVRSATTLCDCPTFKQKKFFWWST
jgi:hypothetical protein